MKATIERCLENEKLLEGTEAAKATKQAALIALAAAVAARADFVEVVQEIAFASYVSGYSDAEASMEAAGKLRDEALEKANGKINPN